MSELKIGGLYKHYKGKDYIVREVARHSETLEWYVVYECLYENPSAKIWIRPMSMFLEDVLVHGEKMPRFKYIGNQKANEPF